MNMIDINEAGSRNGYAHARCDRASTSEKTQTECFPSKQFSLVKYCTSSGNGDKSISH